MVIAARLEAAQQHILNLPTCTARLHALGLDLGDAPDSGDLRLSISRYALDRKRVYDGMASGIAKQARRSPAGAFPEATSVRACVSAPAHCALCAQQRALLLLCVIRKETMCQQQPCSAQRQRAVYLWHRLAGWLSVTRFLKRVHLVCVFAASVCVYVCIRACACACA